MKKIALYIYDLKFGTIIADLLSTNNFEFKFFEKSDFNCTASDFIIIDLDDLYIFDKLDFNKYLDRFSKSIVITCSQKISNKTRIYLKKIGWKWIFSKNTLKKNIINILLSLIK